MRLEQIRNAISKLSLQEVEQVLCGVYNQRKDIYLEWITKEDYDEETIEILKDSPHQFINKDDINTIVYDNSDY